MAFTPKDWKDAPDHSTPLSAAALEDLETRVAGYADTVAGTEASARSAADALLVPKALVDAKGDLLVATADNTVARKAVGADDQVLTADSTDPSGVAWKPPSGGSGARTFFHWGDGTGGTIALPAGVSTSDFGCYTLNGRVYFFGSVSVDLGTVGGASAWANDLAVVPIPADLIPSSLEDAPAVYFTLSQGSNFWSMGAACLIYGDPTHPEFDGIYPLSGGIGSWATQTPAIPSTGVLQLDAGLASWDIAGAP